MISKPADLDEKPLEVHNDTLGHVVGEFAGIEIALIDFSRAMRTHSVETYWKIAEPKDAVGTLNGIFNSRFRSCTFIYATKVRCVLVRSTLPHAGRKSRETSQIRQFGTLRNQIIADGVAIHDQHRRLALFQQRFQLLYKLLFTLGIIRRQSSG